MLAITVPAVPFKTFRDTLLLDEYIRNGQIRKGQLLALTAFGSGFTWGSTLVRY